MNLQNVLLLSLPIVLCGAIAEAVVPPAYDVVEIAPTSTSESNFGAGLNGQGVGVGHMFSGSATGDRGLIFRDGTTEKIGILPSTGSFRSSDAYGINDAGAIVGDSTYADSSQTHAFLRTAAGEMKDLGTLVPGGVLSEARDVNNANQVTGRSNTPGGGFGPFLWENDTFIDLGHFGDDRGRGEAINAWGHVAGWSRDGGDNHAFFWRDRNGNRASDPGDMIDLGVPAGFRHSFAYGINDAGQVVGHLIAFSSSDPQRPFVWQDANANGTSDPGEMTVLDSLLGAGDSAAVDVNNVGWIVGGSKILDPLSFHATLWDDNTVYDLNDLAVWPSGSTPVTLTGATAINDRGQILASGSVSTIWGRKDRVYLLTPVPEPSALALVGVAVASLAVWIRQKRRRSAAWCDN